MGERIRTAEQIRARNEKLRKSLAPGLFDRVILTHGVSESPDRELILHAVRNSEGRQEGNDPYGEDDFGSVGVNGNTYYYKFDYYDLRFEWGADPYEDENYAVVITIMAASEY